MGFSNFISNIGDFVKGITPDSSTVKRTGDIANSYTSAAVTKIDQVATKINQYLPDDEKREQIGLFTTKLGQKAYNYGVNEGHKHIPGGILVVSTLVSETISEMNLENQKDGMKSGEGGSDQNTKDMINTFIKNEFVGNHMFRYLTVHKIARVENKDE